MPTGIRRTRPRLRVFVLVVVLAMLLSAVVTGTASATGGGHPGHGDEVDYWLTVLHNNDGESDLLPDEVVDADGNVIGFEKGVAYFKTTLKQAKKAAKQAPRPPCDHRPHGLVGATKSGTDGCDYAATYGGWHGHHGAWHGHHGAWHRHHGVKAASIFVSSGDNFLAGPTFNASLANGVFYDALSLDRLGYDAIALGNHEFDFGPDLLAEFISEGFRRPGRPPYVSANLDFSLEPALQALADDGVIVKSTVVKKKGEKIGIVGAITPALPTISSPRDVIIRDVAPAVQAEVDSFESKGIEKIVMISHLQDIDGDILLAGELHGVDVMVSGGGDELLANPDDLLLPSDDPDDISGPYPMFAVDAYGEDVPVVTTSGQYGYVGALTVGFHHGDVVKIDDGSGPIRVVSKDFPDGVKPNRWLNRNVVAPVEAFVADLAANVIATSEVDLDGTRSGVRGMETNEGNLMADALRWQATKLAADFGVGPPDVAMQNSGGIRNDSVIPAGDFTELDTFDIAPFGNFVAIVEPISRDYFREFLENTVSRIDPPAAEGGSGRFAQVSGFSFTYDVTGTPLLLDLDGNVLIPGTRIVDVTLDEPLPDGTKIVSGGAVVAGPDISVATNDFSARGGDQWFHRPDDSSFTSVGVSYQQALSNYIQGADGLNGLISIDDYPEGGEGRITQLP